MRASIAVLLVAGCDAGAAVHAFRVSERSELIGGPGAIGDVGDYVLENDRIRVVVSGEGNSPGPGMFGGSIVDVDLVRTGAEFAGANGLDQFSEVFPMVDLVVPGYADGESQEGIGDLAIEILDDGSSGHAAVIRVTGKGDRHVDALSTLAFVGVRTNLSFETDYILEPGRSDLEIVTRVRDDAPGAPTPAEGGPMPMVPLTGDERTFDVLVGDPNAGGDEGLLGGDFLLFGPKVNVFAPGEGHEVQLLFQRGFEANADVVNDAIGVSYLAATGDRVSYAYFAPEGDVLVPIFSSSFTGAFTGRCGFDTCGDARSTEWLEYRRFLSVGEGDVASALEPYYEERRVRTGRIAGHVFDGRTGEPVSGAVVVAMRDPPDDDGTYDDAIAKNRAAGGDAGLVIEATTDTGTDDVHDGDWSARLPPGDYLFFARAPGGLPSPGAPVTIRDGGSKALDLALPAMGRLRVSITDGAGTGVPGKVTLLGPGTCGAAPAGPAGRSAVRELTLGDGELPDGIAEIAFVGEDGASFDVAPGTYEAVVSRGIEYSIDRQCLDIRAGIEAILAASVIHVVDTTGWISGDFHVHGLRSYDAAVSHRARLSSALAEGLDLVSTSDHDAIADLGPTAREMHVDHLIGTMVGLETTTIETGHYIGFPLRRDDRKPESGAIDWTRRDACLADPEAPRCQERDGVLPLVPDEIFSALRDLGSLGPDRTVVVVPHPRDGFFGYFDQFGLSTFDLSLDPSGGNPVLQAENFSPAFDAIELFNAKRFEMIRTPSAAEIADFQRESAAHADDSDAEQARVTQEIARRVLHRTSEEQEELLLPEPECARFEDCPGDEECDPIRKVCTGPQPSCETDSCAEGLVCDQLAPARCRDGNRPTTFHEGVVDDWFRLLDAGLVYTGMGNSDTHDLHGVEVGIPRNFVRSPTDAPGDVEAADVAQAVRAHEVVASFGPFVELWANQAPIGSTIVPDGVVEVCFRVQTPEWFGAERIEIYRNGALVHEGTSDAPPEEITDFDDCFADAPTVDSWYVAIAMSDTTSLAPVYTSVAHPQLGFSQVAALAFAAIHSEIVEAFLPQVPRAPEITAVVPYAVTNPIFVDLAGDGFDAPDPEPAWARGVSEAIAPPLSRARLVDPFVWPERRESLAQRHAEDSFR
jgi:hypothetical protein